MAHPTPPPLLLALLAFHRKFISREQLLEATAAWMTSPEIDLGQLLVDGKYLTPEQREAVDRLMVDWIKTHPTAPGAKPEMSKELRQTIVELRRPTKSPEPAPLPAPPFEDKYILGRELGRGGIGRVVEAVDRELGRKVALKIMLEDAPKDLMERFQWEAKITGRLDHPNIVPVHEVGVLRKSKEVFLSMKRIVGLDMADVIARRQWKLRRIVEAFRDVCRAVSFAHSKGVIHRDLKPANVMLGDFGEVLVVDWGLARAQGEEDRPSALRRASTTSARRSRVAKPDETTHYTLEGDILGTPSYMPPEQAMGKMGEIDERSDVYSLGATLYEILTGRPPFDGETSQEILDMVCGKPIVPPSAIRPCPTELEVICLKAMAYKPQDRFPTVRALESEIEAYLEGTKEVERREQMATEQVERAEGEVARWRKLAAEAKDCREKALAVDIPTAAPREVRQKLWALEDRAERLERESVEAYAEASAALSSALSLLPTHNQARRLMASLYWEKALEAEEAGNVREHQVYRRFAENWNDGHLDAPIRGDGTLALRTLEYRCPCLRERRPVAPADLRVAGYHPWSGRGGASSPPPPAPELDSTEPVSLRVHAATCRAEPLPGAEAWAWKFESIDRLLIPVTPEGSRTGPPAPAALLDDVFGNSPFRPRGPGIYLGRTPVGARAWPMGSWIMVVSSAGKSALRIPFVVKRQEEVALEPVLYGPEEVPEGFRVVSGGAFVSHTESGGFDMHPPKRVVLDDFFLAIHPVRSAEWRDYMNATAPDAAAALAEKMRWPRTPKGYVVPTARWLAEASAAEKEGVQRLPGANADWEEDWPVFAVNWMDAAAYAAWRSRGDGRVFTLPHMHQWEKAARGADQRLYPWGRYADETLCNVNNSHLDGERPVPVHAFPTDESPWGIRGLAGNAADFCLNPPGSPYQHWRTYRGGAWKRTVPFARLSYHHGGNPDMTNYTLTVRLAVAARLEA